MLKTTVIINIFVETVIHFISRFFDEYIFIAGPHEEHFWKCQIA